MVHLRSLVAAALGIAVLAVWHYGHQIGCIALIFIPLVAVPIALGLWEASLFRRRVLADSVFVRGTLLHRFYHGGAISLLKALATALVVATMLLLDLTGEEIWIFYALAGDTLLLIVLMTGLDRLFVSRLLPRARRIVVKSWATWINAAFLVALKIEHEFFALKPPLREGGGFTTYPGPSHATHCEILSILLSLRGRIDGRMRVEMEAVDATLPGLVLWIAFLAVSALGAFGFSRYMVEILDRSRPWRMDA